MNANPDAILNILGKTVYLDDIDEPKGLLHGAVVVSKSAHGKIVSMDLAPVLAFHPSVRVLTATDIPGMNELNEALKDEPLIAGPEWTYLGQTLALVLAESRSIARAAAERAVIRAEELEVITDSRVAAGKGLFILPSRTQKSGDPEKAFAEAPVVIQGRVDSGGQEHVYLETQGAFAWRDESGAVRLISGTQAPSAVQKAVATVLGLPMNMVTVETKRLGGGFGGKEDQAAQWSALAALGTAVTGKPVKLCLNRRDDMRYTGKRHPYSTDFRMALDKDGTILAFEADYWQNSGACCDLSPAILSRTLFHAAGAYRIPNLRVTGHMCRTNLPPFTAFRGFGAPQGIFVIESAIAMAAEKLGIRADEIQAKNILKPGDSFHYGMKVKECRTERCVERVKERCSWELLKKDIETFNTTHGTEKRGVWIMPLAFGVSFTKLMMNQGGALVHVYSDGSVGVHTGAVEMGQGVNRKISLIVADALRIRIEKIRMETAKTSTVANTMPTAASTGTDLNGMAAAIACGEIRKRIDAFAAKADLDPEDWETIVLKAHEARIDLSAHGFYAPDGLVYDMKTENGTPFMYHVYGASVVQATVDLIRGTYRFDKAWIVHDSGKLIDGMVDAGQLEGAFAQGLGWAALEDLRFDEKGKLLSDTLSTYKLPDVHFMPSMDYEFLDDVPNPWAVMGSKAIGEPPFMYGIPGYFAVMEALKAARPGKKSFFDLPMTPEKALLFLELP